MIAAEDDDNGVLNYCFSGMIREVGIINEIIVDKLGNGITDDIIVAIARLLAVRGCWPRSELLFDSCVLLLSVTTLGDPFALD